MILGVIGIGHGGSKLAAELAKLGHRAVAINLSGADLESVRRMVPAQLRLAGADGAAKDPRAGLMAAEQNADKILAFLHEHFGKQTPRAIMVTFALGGGTGSGAGPAVAELAASNLPGCAICPVPILPGAEAWVARANALESFSVLSGVQSLGASLIVDNGQAAELFDDEAIDRMEMWGGINLTAAGLIDAVARLPERAGEENIDEEEVMALLGTRGSTVIGRAILPRDRRLAPVDVATLIRESWRRSPWAPVENRAARGAGVWIAPAAGTAALDWRQVFAPGFPPAEWFEGIYEPAYGAEGEILTVLAGLPWPEARLREMESGALEEMEAAAAAVPEPGRFTTTIRRRPAPAAEEAAEPAQEATVGSIFARQRAVRR